MTIQSDFARLPEELPPVEPPSAGFIAQLFLVPGLIVLAIVGVWLVVSKMASVEQDWRSLVIDIQNPQEQIRSRAIFGLAQQLAADQGSIEPGPQLGEKREPKLRDNRQLAQSLSDYLIKELKHSTPDEATIKQQTILARTLGLFHLPNVVLPALVEAIDVRQDIEVRKNALGSIAVIAGRAVEKKEPLKLDVIEPAVVAASHDELPLIRQMSAFVLGLLPGKPSLQRLQVLILDADQSTRVNAAVGLARQDSTAGFDVFLRILKDAIAKPEAVGSPEEFTQFAQIKNTLAALQKVESKLSDKQRADLKPVLEPLSQSYREPKLRVEAKILGQALSSD